MTGIIVPIERVEKYILFIREQKVILDADLARLYGVTTKKLNQQVKRNRERFPNDFMFQLNKEEKEEVVTNCDHLFRLKYSSSLPYAFTEHGAIMAASVLSSKRAIDVSVFVVRAFIKIREIAITHRELAKKVADLEKRVGGHDESIKALLTAIRKLIEPPQVPKRRQIGFHIEDKKNNIK